MKKIVTTILGASLLAGALYAAGNHDKMDEMQSSNNHMGDHMHEGKMVNHMNKNGMTNQEVNDMK